MITKLIGAATLFAAGSLVSAGSTSLGATPVDAFGAEASLSQGGSFGAQDAKDAKEEGKAPAKAKAKDAKSKDGTCGKGSCGSKDKKMKKDGSCGKDKKEGSCSKDKKEASSEKDKK